MRNGGGTVGNGYCIPDFEEGERGMKKTLTNYMGLLGIVSLLSFAAAVIFAPRAYPGYDWMAQAVSDLSAESSPSRTLCNQISALYAPCGIVCCTVSCIAIQGYCNRMLRAGVYLFAVMNWVTAVGYSMFPLTDAGNPNGFQNIMHLVVTVAVVVLSIVSLVMIFYGGWHKRACRSLGLYAAVALLLMLVGGIGVNIAPKEYLGLLERFSLFSVTGFNAVLGIYLFKGWEKQ